MARQRLVTRGFDDWRDGRQLDLQAPPVTVADRGIWHDSGTKLNRRQSATMAGASADQTYPTSLHRAASEADRSKRRRPTTMSEPLSAGSCDHLAGSGADQARTDEVRWLRARPDFPCLPALPRSIWCGCGALVSHRNGPWPPGRLSAWKTRAGPCGAFCAAAAGDRRRVLPSAAVAVTTAVSVAGAADSETSFGAACTRLTTGAFDLARTSNIANSASAGETPSEALTASDLRCGVGVAPLLPKGRRGPVTVPRHEDRDLVLPCSFLRPLCHRRRAQRRKRTRRPKHHSWPGRHFPVLVVGLGQLEESISSPAPGNGPHRRTAP